MSGNNLAGPKPRTDRVDPPTNNNGDYCSPSDRSMASDRDTAEVSHNPNSVSLTEAVELHLMVNDESYSEARLLLLQSYCKWEHSSIPPNLDYPIHLSADDSRVVV